MAKKARHHHYVPKFYLAGFTDTETVDGKLHVFDAEQSKQWSRTPKDAAHERDFHAVDLGPNQDPMVIENKLAECEGKWSNAIRTVMEDEELPADDLLGDLLAFVAFMTVRVPRIRNQVTDFIDRASKAELRATFATSEGREHFRRVMVEIMETFPLGEQRQYRKLLDDDPDLEQMAEYAKSDDFTVSYEQTWNVQTMVQMAITLLPVLGLRKWALWTPTDDVPDLICSDSPVCLSWDNLLSGPYPPGFGVKNTVVTVPVSKRLLLVSKFDDLEVAKELTAAEIAATNSRTTMYADQVYSSDADFVWQKPNGEVGNGDDFLDSRRSDHG